MSKPTRAGMLSHRRSAAGFTLLEMLMVIVIVGLLMGIALPSYQETMRKGRRADAKAGLLDAANRQERHLLDIGTYTTDMTALGFAVSPMISTDGYYSIAAIACGSGTIQTCYELRATARAGFAQEGDAKCGWFNLSSTGAKTAYANNECW